MPASRVFDLKVCGAWPSSWSGATHLVPSTRSPIRGIAILVRAEFGGWKVCNWLRLDRVQYQHSLYFLPSLGSGSSATRLGFGRVQHFSTQSDVGLKAAQDRAHAGRHRVPLARGRHLHPPDGQLARDRKPRRRESYPRWLLQLCANEGPGSCTRVQSGRAQVGERAGDATGRGAAEALSSSTRPTHFGKRN